ncbi:MAG: hypothetical protein U0822_26685 [Anaerolineae bacterium]
MNLFVPLLPVLYLIGAIAWVLLNRRQAAVAPWIPVAATAAGLLVAIALAGTTASITLLRWEPVMDFGGAITFAVDPITSAFLVLIAVLALAAALNRQRDETAGGPHLVTAALLLSSAAVSFILANNLLTLACAWVWLDAAAIMALRWRQDDPAPKALRVQAFSLNYLTGLALFVAAAATTISGPMLAGAFWAPGMVNGLPAALIALAAVVRLGVYPFHRNMPDAGSGPLAAWLRLVPLAVGAYLLTRAASLAIGPPLTGILWSILIAGSALAAAGMAVSATNRLDMLRWLSAYAGATLAQGATTGGVLAAPLAVAGSIVLVLAIGVLFLAESLPQTRWIPWVRALAALAILGLPLTLGFIYRWGVYSAALGTGDGVTAVIMAFAAAIAAGALWVIFRSPAPADPSASPDPLPAVGVVLLAAPIVILGVLPSILQAAFEIAAGQPMPDTLTAWLAGGAGPLGVSVALLIAVPMACGWGLARVRERLMSASPVQSWRYYLALDWVYTVHWRPAGLIGQIYRSFRQLFENERYVGFVVVLALILGLILLSQQQLPQ